jgi:hypothetical protein
MTIIFAAPGAKARDDRPHPTTLTEEVRLSGGCILKACLADDYCDHLFIHASTLRMMSAFG